jgi:hypothetical protein
MTIKSTILSLYFSHSYFLLGTGTWHKKVGVSTGCIILHGYWNRRDNYFGSYDGKLYALKPAVTKKWEYLTILLTLTGYWSDGTIYIDSLIINFLQ